MLGVRRNNADHQRWQDDAETTSQQLCTCFTYTPVRLRTGSCAHVLVSASRERVLRHAGPLSAHRLARPANNILALLSLLSSGAEEAARRGLLFEKASSLVTYLVLTWGYSHRHPSLAFEYVRRGFLESRRSHISVCNSRTSTCAPQAQYRKWQTGRAAASRSKDSFFAQLLLLLLASHSLAFSFLRAALLLYQRPIIGMFASFRALQLLPGPASPFLN